MTAGDKTALSHCLGSAARPRCTELADSGARRTRSLSLGRGEGGSGRRGPRWAGAAGSRNSCHSGAQLCSSAGDPQTSLGAQGLPAAFQLLQPGRVLPTGARSRSPRRRRPPPNPPSFHSHAPKPPCGSCILDSPGCDAEKARARHSLPLLSLLETARDPVLTFTATRVSLPQLWPLCAPSDWGRGVLSAHRGSPRLGEFLVFLGHPSYHGGTCLPCKLET